MVPLSGEGSIPGDISRFVRAAGTSPDVTDGHNSPIMIEMLRQYKKQGLIKKESHLTKALIKHGSRDVDKLKALAMVEHTTRRNWNQEGAKQGVVGRNMQPNVFAAVYENNVVYNIYVERVMQRIGNIKSKRSNDIVGLLIALHKEVIAQSLKHTANSLHQLEAFTEYKSKLKLRWLYKNQESAKRQIDKIARLKELKGIHSRTIKENKTRLRQQMANLWLAANPDKAELFKEVSNLWKERIKAEDLE